MSAAQDLWTGVGLDRQIQPASSNPVIVNGQALAVWRGEEGPVRIWEDRCPHRGMRLSFGFVRDNTLRCIYHGWAYGTDGQCTEIPAHPALAPPKTICANAFPAETRYGIVWTRLSKDGEAPLPDLGADEGWEPVRSLYMNRSAEDVAAALTAFDFGQEREIRMMAENVAMLTFGPEFRMLAAIQPIEDGRTALHVVAKGASAAGDRAAWAKKLERLRAAIERA